MRPFFLEILLASLLHVRVLEGRQRWARKSKNHEVAEHWGGQEPGQMPNDRVGALAPGAAAATKRRQWTLREEARMSSERNAHLFIITSRRLLLRVQTAAYFRDLFDFFGLYLWFSIPIFSILSIQSVRALQLSKLLTAITQTVQKIGSAKPFINLRSSYWSILDQWEAQSVLP